jgi:hypothetical protein
MGVAQICIKIADVRLSAMHRKDTPIHDEKNWNAYRSIVGQQVLVKPLDMQINRVCNSTPSVE